MNTSSLQKAKPTKISRYFEVTPNEGGSICQMFNTLNVQLTTRFDVKQHCTSYDLFLQNYDKLNLSAQTVTAVGGTEEEEEEGDLLVLLEALKYIVYHPFLSRKLNKYDVTIYTNSKHIANFSVLDDDTLTTTTTTTTTTHIRSLLGCIHLFSIILQ